MSFISRWFSRREPVPSTDGDLESQSHVQSIELSRPSVREEDGIVIVDQAQVRSASVSPMTSGASSVDASSGVSESGAQQEATSTSTSETTSDNVLAAFLYSRLNLMKKATQFMIVLTVLQIMATLGTEHIHFLSLFSLFVPWCGYEGSKERNFAYLRAFYWGCWIMIPANFFHYLSFEELVQEIMATNIDDNLRKELVFNHTLFNIVTIIIGILMMFSLIWVRQISIVLRSIHTLGEEFMQNGRGREGPRVPTGPLNAEEIAAIPAFKLTNEDITGEGAEKDVCVICQDDFQANDLAKRLNCRHVFHAQCIDAWLERSSSCPICNGDVRSIV